MVPGGPTSDAYDHVWGYWWWAHALGNGRNPLVTTLSHQPAGGALWFVDPLNALLAAPLQAVTSTATATTLVLTAQVFLGMVAVWLGLRKEAPMGAPVAAVIVAAGPYTLGLLQSGVYEFVALGPLAGFYLALRAGTVEAQRPADASWVCALLWFLAALGNFYYAAFAGLLALVVLVERPAAWRLVRGTAVLALPPIILLAGFALLTLYANDAVVDPQTAPGWAQGSLPAVDPLAFVHAGEYYFPDNRRMGNVGIVHVAYVGWVALGLAGVGLLASARPFRALAAPALALVFALGPALAWHQHPLRLGGHDVWMPLAALYFPGSPFAFVHHPYRLVAVLMLALSPFIASGVQYLAGRSGWGLTAGLIALVLIETATWSPMRTGLTTAPVAAPKEYAAAALNPTVTGIFDFPPHHHVGNRQYEMYAIFHHKRMPYGVNSFLPAAWKDNGLVLAMLGCVKRPQMLGIPREGGPPASGWFSRTGLVSPAPTAAQVVTGAARLIADGYSHVVLHPEHLKNQRVGCLSGLLATVATGEGEWWGMGKVR